MKKSAGRKEMRQAIRRNRIQAGKKKAKWNNWMSKHPYDSRMRKKENGADGLHN